MRARSTALVPVAMLALALGAASAPARAQHAAASAATAAATEAAPFGPPVEDNMLYAHALLDELEGLFGGGQDPALRWEGAAWAGTDSGRLWFKSEGQMVNGRVEGGDQELLYSHPVSEFFDLQAGVRYDLDSGPGRGWGAIGVEGLAPYLFQVATTLYASDGGHFAARTRFSRELLLTQRLILTPSVELNAYTRQDPRRDVASGVSDIEAGLRLRYEISRKFAPYAGVVYERLRGTDAAGSSSGWRAAVGVRAWY